MSSSVQTDTPMTVDEATSLVSAMKFQRDKALYLRDKAQVLADRLVRENKSLILMVDELVDLCSLQKKQLERYQAGRKARGPLDYKPLLGLVPTHSGRWH